MTISLEQYFAGKPHTQRNEEDAVDLLNRVEALKQDYYADTGRGPDIDPDTGTEISGKKGGQGDGGFRLLGSSSSVGRKSSHEEARGVDPSDQDNDFDNWLDQFEDGQGGNTKLEQFGLYREDPRYTITWSHLTTRAPHSGHRTFIP